MHHGFSLSVLLLVQFLVGPVVGVASETQSQPNIILLLVDDTGWNALDIPADPDIAGSGSTYYRTPNTSKLALSGIRFSMAYSAAPTCAPSRTSIQFGMTPIALGKFADSKPTNLPAKSDAMINRLKAAHPKYRAAHFGKWHIHGCEPDELGFDESDGHTQNQEGNDCPPDDPKLTFSLAKKASDFITRQAKEKNPFFLQVSFYANHLDYTALPETIAEYESRSDQATKYQNSPLWAAMHEHVDTAVGSIVDVVDRLGIRDNTYIIYTADNGYESKVDQGKAVKDRTFHKAYPLLSHKYMISEGGLRVPFLIRGPGIPAGSTSREAIVAMDIFPTVLDMTGSLNDVPERVEGGSLLSHCKTGGDAKVRRTDSYLVFRYSKPKQSLDVAIVQDGYKFLIELESGDEHLWSLWDDLGEQDNLVKSNPGLARKLKQSMEDYFTKHDWDPSQHSKAKRKK